MVHINLFPRNNQSLNGMQVFSFYRKKLISNAFAKSLLSSYTSVYNCLTTRFVHNTNLASVWNYHRPWQVQKLTSLSIFEREFLLCKNVATARNHGHPCPL